MNTRLCLLIAIFAVATLVGRSDTAVDPGNRARILLAQLANALQVPTLENLQSIPKLRDELAALGEQALPVFEEELPVGIKFSELNQLLINGRSQRIAAAMVLAEIPGDASTRLLYGSAFDVPDNGAMHTILLDAMKERTLGEEMVLGLLGHHHPDFVQAGIGHAARMTNSPPVVARLGQLLDEDHLLAQFVNEYGKNATSEDMRWRVRWEAGKALGKDMSEEVRTRARMVLKSLAELSTRLGDVNQINGYGSNLSGTEHRVVRGIEELVELGGEAKNIAQESSTSATAEYADLLVLVAARFGDHRGIGRAIDLLTQSPVPSVRVCAAITLRRIGTPEAKPAFWKALQDPFVRGLNHPVRIVAADALVELGEDSAQVMTARTPVHPEPAHMAPPTSIGESPDER